jgi:hypothetical protein
LSTGISIRVKLLNHFWIENLLFAIDNAEDHGIINLRLEECRISRKAIARLIDFCKTKNIIESLGLHKVSFDDG